MTWGAACRPGTEEAPAADSDLPLAVAGRLTGGAGEGNGGLIWVFPFLPLIVILIP